MKRGYKGYDRYALNYTGDFKYKLIISLLVAIVLVFLFIFFWNYFFNGEIESNLSISICGDGTLYGTCSLNKPYYCDSETGLLIEKASICGCPEKLDKNGEICSSQYYTGSKEVSLKYILRGQEHLINFKTYNGVEDYLSSLSRSISYQNGEIPLRADFKIKTIQESIQREALVPLLVEIQNIAKTKEDQFRIATSIIQNIDFGESEKFIEVPGGEVRYERYPYEVIYDQQGVCGEKSALLAFLLKELGYEIAFFYHNEENHEALGVKCPIKYSLDNTGYCFIETTGPSIITDDGIEYVGGIKLESVPEIIPISIGAGLGEGMYEYEDAKVMKRIRESSWIKNIFSRYSFKDLEKKYGLVEEYNP